MFFAGAGGVAGAKLWYVVEKGDLGSLFSGTGLVFYGGALGGALAVMAYARAIAASSTTACSTWARRGWRSATRSRGSAASSRATATTASPPTCRGRWPIPKGTVPTTVEVHPTPIYELIVMGAVTVWLWRRRDRVRPGELIGWWAVLSGIERFLIEFIRRNDDILGPFSLAQIVSVVSIVAGDVVAAARALPRPRLRARRRVPSPRSSAPAQGEGGRGVVLEGRRRRTCRASARSGAGAAGPRAGHELAQLGVRLGALEVGAAGGRRRERGLARLDDDERVADGRRVELAALRRCSRRS